ncbi:MAG: hypothetical protein ACUVRM_06415, partial [Bacillota bacterium]
MHRTVKWPLRPLFRPPRERRLLYWVGLASGLLLPLITWADRSMPLIWKCHVKPRKQEQGADRG